MRHYRLAVAEARIVEGPAIIETILGSCVAAVFWHPESKVGAMCHAALPVCPPSVARSPDPTPGLRYVDYSLRYLLTRLKSKGIDPARLQVKLFGGANVLAYDPARQTVGRQNCLTAKRILQEEGLHLDASDLGGALGRVIYLRTDSGEVFLRRLQAPEPSARAPRVMAAWES
jgi:chemotaxis receptor (MCP) glutamine deamidase CheD